MLIIARFIGNASLLTKISVHNFGAPLPLLPTSKTPNPYNLSEKYWRYTSNLHRSTPPICNAVPRWLPSLEEREVPQCTSNLYCSTPPICTAVRHPFVPAILLREYQWLPGWGFREVPEQSDGYIQTELQTVKEHCTIKRSQIVTLPSLQKTFVNFLFKLAWEFCIENCGGFLVNFFWSPFPTKRSTKTHQKIRGKIGAKFGAKFGTKIRKIRGTFVLQLF